MKTQHLTYLEKNWLTATTAKGAIGYFRNSKPGERRWMLRHHEESGIKVEETWMRDEFDYLLEFYSIVEIALTVGFVEDLPDAFAPKHLTILVDPAVRRYYELNYQLDLPRRLRERLQTGLGYQLPGTAQLNSYFYEFLELTKLIERDEDLESFLWTLDGGRRDGCSFDKVEKALLKANPLFKALQTANDKKTELDHALVGFCKFIEFCEGLSSLLLRMKDVPVAAEAMWLAHAYWFRQLDHLIGDNLRLAFKALAKWKVGLRNEKALKRRVENLTKLMQEIAVPPMTKWKTRVTVVKPGSKKVTAAELEQMRSIVFIPVMEPEPNPTVVVAAGSGVSEEPPGEEFKIWLPKHHEMQLQAKLRIYETDTRIEDGKIVSVDPLPQVAIKPEDKLAVVEAILSLAGDTAIEEDLLANQTKLAPEKVRVVLWELANADLITVLGRKSKRHKAKSVASVR